MMDKSDTRVFAQKCKGHPSLKQSEEIKIHGERKGKLRQLHKYFSMKKYSEILLSLSFHCWQWHATSGTHVSRGFLHLCHFKHESTKRDIFILVLKDASRETNIGSASVLPCGKLWIPSMLHQKFFGNCMETLRFPVCDWCWLTMILSLTVHLIPLQRLWKSYRLQSICCVFFML